MRFDTANDVIQFVEAILSLLFLCGLVIKASDSLCRNHNPFLVYYSPWYSTGDPLEHGKFNNFRRERNEAALPLPTARPSMRFDPANDVIQFV